MTTLNSFQAQLLEYGGGGGGGTGGAGFQGVQGFIGRQGLQGPQGIVGIQGNAGVQGGAGFQGVQGFIGTQGIQGTGGIGAQGLQGISGSQGIVGIQGNAGINGVQGVQGLVGPTGAGGGGGSTGVFLYAGNPNFTQTTSASYTNLATITNVVGIANQSFRLTVQGYFDATGLSTTFDVRLTDGGGTTLAEFLSLSGFTNGSRWILECVFIIRDGSFTGMSPRFYNSNADGFPTVQLATTYIAYFSAPNLSTPQTINIEARRGSGGRIELGGWFLEKIC